MRWLVQYDGYFVSLEKQNIRVCMYYISIKMTVDSWMKEPCDLIYRCHDWHTITNEMYDNHEQTSWQISLKLDNECIAKPQFRNNLTMKCSSWDERYRIADGTPKCYIAPATHGKYSWQGKIMSQNVTKQWHPQPAITIASTKAKESLTISQGQGIGTRATKI